MKKQIEGLQRKAEKLRQQEITGVISRIKVAIAHYDLTAEQLGYSTSSKTKGREARQVLGYGFDGPVCRRSRQQLERPRAAPRLAA
jgi:hypothetical protein